MRRKVQEARSAPPKLCSSEGIILCIPRQRPKNGTETVLAAEEQKKRKGWKQINASTLSGGFQRGFSTGIIKLHYLPPRPPPRLPEERDGAAERLLPPEERLGLTEREGVERAGDALRLGV